MEKNNEQGKAWEDIAIPGFEQAPPPDEETGEAITETARNTIADIFIIVEAWKILAPLKGKAAGPVDPDLKNALEHLEKGNASYEIKINALFTGLSGQDLEEAEALSPDQIEELKAFFYRLDEFIFEEQKEDPDATIGRLIVKFVYLEKPKQTPQERRRGFEIVKYDKIIDAVAFIPLDPLNRHTKLWSDEKEQIKAVYDPNGAPKGSGIQARIYCDVAMPEALNVDGVEISKKLDCYDMRVAGTLDQLWNSGIDKITHTKFLELMGFTNIGSPQIKRLIPSLVKVNAAQCVIDNIEESKALKHRKRFKYRGSVAPNETLTEYDDDGNAIGIYIHILGGSGPMEFARQRKQFTTVPLEVLQSPLNKTEENLRIEAYLLGRIASIESQGPKILLATLCKDCGIEGKQRQRAPEKIEALLNYYKKTNQIKAYKWDYEKRPGKKDKLKAVIIIPA